MKLIPETSTLRTIIIILITFKLIGMIALLIAFQANKIPIGREPNPLVSPSPDTTETTTEGKLVCLPHKNTSGPITLECAIGLKTLANEHYALDTAAFASSILLELSMDQNIAVTGTVTPLAQVLDTSVKKYDIVGVIHVMNVEKKP